MEPASLLAGIFGALAGKSGIRELFLLAGVVIAWWIWRDKIFRPTAKRVRR